ncbi:MAG: aminotransferase class IV family protein [Bacteroidota bacterium]
MYPLFETIRIGNGKLLAPEWHEERMKNARKECWNISEPLFLQDLVDVPEQFRTGTIRCKLLYGQDPGPVSFSLYHKRQIQKLKLIENNVIDYRLKYTDRSIFDQLLACRGDCDEIIIVKNGMITDTSISNLIFFDGEQWVTPRFPLLNGICRQRLLAEGRIKEADIGINDLEKYAGLKLINAMRDPDGDEIISMNRIVY